MKKIVAAFLLSIIVTNSQVHANALQIVPVQRPPDIVAKAKNDKSRILPEGVLPADGRLAGPRTLRDPSHPWTPAANLGAWQKREAKLREQLLVATGLWPLPEKTPLNPVIHGTIDKGEYTIEKVFFESYPGHFVTGNLYRPKGQSGKRPAVLSPHGHWQNGRFYDAGEKEAKKQIEQGAEKYLANARFVLQARMASLARMGCVVFHYDMVGVADSNVIPHGGGFADTEAMLRLQSAMGLQTWNTIRAYDFLESLDDVDPKRIGVSGASGGGTQTFMLCALDSRPAVGFPAVMVSTDMQGGCVCENCPLLRVGTTNVEFAAMFAPKPYAMTSADDWTRNMPTSGFPELQAHYAMFGVPGNVALDAFLQFGHNYNQVSREVMYRWMNRHLDLGLGDTSERPIDPVPPEKLSVFDDEHPLPERSKDIRKLRQFLTDASDQALAKLQPKDHESLQQFQSVVGRALGALLVDEFPLPADVMVTDVGSKRVSNVMVDRLLLARRQAKTLLPTESIPAAVFLPEEWNGRMVVMVDSEGHANLMDAGSGLPGPRIQQLLDRSYAVLAPDVYLTGEFHAAERYTQPPRPDLMYAGYTFCYNRTPLANRVHDILTAVACAKYLYGAESVDLVASGDAGPWVVLARGLCGENVRRTVADCKLGFKNVRLPSDPMFLPGGLKYGDLISFARLVAPGELYLAGYESYRYGDVESLKQTFNIAGNPGGLVLEASDLDPEERDRQVLAWLVR